MRKRDLQFYKYILDIIQPISMQYRSKPNPIQTSYSIICIATAKAYLLAESFIVCFQISRTLKGVTGKNCLLRLQLSIGE